MISSLHLHILTLIYSNAIYSNHYHPNFHYQNPHETVGKGIELMSFSSVLYKSF